MPSKVINVGVIGCGVAAQVLHIPSLNLLNEWFAITYICGASPSALEFCSKRVVSHVPKTTSDPAVLCASPDVDVVFVINSDEYHPQCTILALKHNKDVFVEKPMAMTQEDANAIIDAEKASKGRVFVGYMRRYAAGFIDAVKEVGGLEKILYARVRDIIGPNPIFIGQSATFPKQFSDYEECHTKERSVLANELAAQGLGEECQIEPIPELVSQYRCLGGLGSHDLSAMREALGDPDSILGFSRGPPFWNVLFKYATFTVSYESGFHNIPCFDAHIEVYGANKSVRVQYDSPFIKGLPVTLHIKEDVDGALKETTIRKTYEDPFTLELKELYATIVEGKLIKTTAVDALEDVYLFQMIMKAGARNF